MSEFLENLAAKCPAGTPFRFLRFTWFGDYACSSGAHYFPGTKISFEQALEIVNKECSDDLIENMVCWIMKDSLPQKASLGAWRALCFQLYDLIKDDYLPDPVRYSPEYAELFAGASEADYLSVIARTTNCGGAMRSASLAYAGATTEEHCTLVGMTHLHPEAMAGAYALFEAVRTLTRGGSVDEMWEAALGAAQQGEEKAIGLLKGWGHPAEKSLFLDWLQGVQDNQDARYGLMDWKAEGISSRFVVSGAMQIAAEAIPLGPEKGLRHVIEQGLEIGGDPDTLGSMGMALIGARFGEELHRELDRVIEELIPPENIDIPSFLISPLDWED
jgi:hypothetical protein